MTHSYDFVLRNHIGGRVHAQAGHIGTTTNMEVEARAIKHTQGHSSTKRMQKLIHLQW